MFKKICLLALISLSQIVFADPLVFPVGQRTTYTFSEEHRTNFTASEFAGGENSKVIMTFDFEILSSNPDNQSYPFEVAIVVKDLDVTLRSHGINGTASFDYKSKSAANSKNTALAHTLDLLIDHPLTFIIKKPDQVAETTLFLSDFCKEIAQLSDIDFMFSDKEEVTDLISQLVYLSDEDLKTGKTYLSKEDFPVSDLTSEFNLNKRDLVISGSPDTIYQIKSVNSDETTASIELNMGITSKNKRKPFSLILKGNGESVWDTENALIQKGNVSVNLAIKAQYRDGDTSFPLEVVTFMSRSWEAVSWE